MGLYRCHQYHVPQDSARIDCLMNVFGSIVKPSLYMGRDRNLNGHQPTMNQSFGALGLRGHLTSLTSS